jgi:signal transduction histidine kinase
LRVLTAGRTDGGTISVEASLRHVTTEGGDFAMAVLRDIPERKQLEEALREAKSRAEAIAKANALFLSSMGQEIRTPVNAIVGMAQVLSESGVPDEQLRPVQHLIRAVDHLLTLIETSGAEADRPCARARDR